MRTRRSFFAALGVSLAAAASLVRRRPPRFVERTSPGNRYRELPLGEGRLYLREDLLKSGWYRDFRFHAKREGER